MSDATTTTLTEAAAAEGPAEPSAAVRAWAWIEGRLVAIADRANPILVKETRQALKSKQFVATFLIVLLACWLVSIGGVLWIGPGIRYEAAGEEMLRVYYAVLALPLTIVVPYGAFRSISSEREDNTYDLLSISTLTPRQIITGKLGSAIVQMLVFFSAVSPCLAFTFLLKGVDVLTVALILAYMILGSLALSALALLAGTLVQARYSMVIASVALVAVLIGAFVLGLMLAEVFLQEGYIMLRQKEFWIGNLAFLTLYATTFALVTAAAAMRITFPSDNRSTPLRWLMLIQQVCFLGWLALLFQYDPPRDAVRGIACAAIGFSTAYWYAFGSLMTSEWPFLSRRVRRSLPSSRVGCWGLSWFYPGPGTGFMFALSNVSAVAVVGLATALLMAAPGGGSPSRADAVYFTLLCWGYLVAFLGVGLLLIRLLRRVMYVSMPAGFLVHAVIFIIACGMPTVVQFFRYSTSLTDATPLMHLSNPVWTLVKLVDRGSQAIEPETSTVLVLAVAMVALLLNLRWIAAETHARRAALPTRVQEDEAALHPAPAPRPTSPWENDE